MLRHFLPVLFFVANAALGANDLNPPITMEKIVDWSETKKAADIADLLEVLPKAMKASPAWVFETQSAQRASAPAPRGILHDPEGGLTIAFSGTDKDPRRDQLEMLQFRRETATFELYVLDFSKRPPKLSQKNPPGCVRCHGVDPRPNWDAYPEWPGVYGSKHHAQSPSDGDYEKFARASKDHPRYGKFPLLDRLPGDALFGRLNALSEPNSRLTDSLGAENSLRLARLMRAAPLGTALFPAVAALAIGCRPVDTLFPERWKNVAAKTAKWIDDHGAQTDVDKRVLSIVAFYRELGVETRDWSMTHDRVNPRFTLPGSDYDSLVAALVPHHAALAETFAVETTKGYRAPYAKPKDGKPCDKLAAASVAALRNVAPPAPVAPPPRPVHRR